MKPSVMGNLFNGSTSTLHHHWWVYPISYVSDVAIGYSNHWGIIKGIPKNKPRLGMFYYWRYHGLRSHYIVKSKESREILYLSIYLFWGGYYIYMFCVVTICKLLYIWQVTIYTHVGKTIINHPLFHHFYRLYAYHSQMGGLLLFYPQ